YGGSFPVTTNNPLPKEPNMAKEKFVASDKIQPHKYLHGEAKKNDHYGMPGSAKTVNYTLPKPVNTVANNGMPSNSGTKASSVSTGSSNSSGKMPRGR